ncbi:MAG: hypothetical protein Rubg2KO_30440 [Rubricoccaceae bacterium]
MRFLVALAALIIAAPADAQIRGGTYTLGASGATFSSFNDAFAQLESDGISGAVVIEVQPGTYAERAELGTVAGVTDKNTITFRGIASGSTLPTISDTPTSSDPFLIRLVKSPYVTFDNLRFEVANAFQSRGTLLLIESDNVIVQNCEFESIDDGSVGSDDAVGIDVYGTDVLVQDNEIDDGDIGIRFSASSGGPTSGGQILNNTVDRNVSAGIVVEGQSVSSGNAVSIRDNFANQNAVDEAGWVGIWVRDVTGGAVLARNTVFARSGTGILVQDVTNDTSAWTSVVNNAVFGSRFRTRGNAEGIQIDDAERVRVLNNSVWIEGSQVAARNGGTALFIEGNARDVRVVNNILVHDGDGLNLEIEDLGSITDLDYQVFEAPTTPNLMRVVVEGAEYDTMTKYQGITGDSQNTIAWTVEFSSASLRLTGRSDGDGRLIGQPEPGVPFDIDGDARNATRPYRGADEATTPLADPPPLLSGTYVIGSAGDYADFREAFEAIDTQGLGGPVTFIVQNGTYTEPSGGFFSPLDIDPFPGSSSARTVTFRGGAGNPATVILESDAPNFNFNWVLRLTNVQYLTFQDLTFRSTSPDFHDVLDVRGGSDIVFDGCVFTNAATTATGTLLQIGGGISDADRNPRDVRVLNSTFTGGRTAINVQVINAGGTFGDEGGFEVSGNTITSPHATAFTGVAMNGLASGTVRDNRVVAATSGSSFIGLDIGGSGETIQSDVIVEANEVLAGDGIGIAWDRYEPNGSGEPQIVLRMVNNLVRMTGNGDAVGVRITDSEGLLAAHNTVSVTSTDPASAAVFVASIPQVFSTLDLRNNILEANLGRALVLDLPTLSSRYVHDDNAYWTNGTALATLTFGSAFDGDCADLVCMQTASTNTFTNQGQDENSVEKQVAFEDAATGDLRLASSMFGDQDLAGVGIPEVTTDIDGDDRSPSRPYRGADEAVTTLSFIAFRLRVYLQGAYAGGCGTDCVDLSTALQDGGHLPLSNPYADPAFDGTLAEYDGTESVTQGQLDAMGPVTDWVVVELRETSDGPAVYRGARLLNHRGKVLAFDGSENLNLPVPESDYHVVVYHRNHLPVISTLRALVDESATITFVRLHRTSDLIGGASGAAQLASFNLYGMAAADGSGDGLVTAPDFNVYSSASASGATGYQIADFTMDGLVTAPDFNLYNANAAAGAATAVPQN